MLEHIYADGFRSLDQFDMDVRPGLNILVGPNGGGKTNILALFSFLSALSDEEVGDAINASGGVSKVFKKTGKASFAKSLTIRVLGSYNHEQAAYLPASYEKILRDQGVTGLRYEWDFTIDSSLGYDEVFYSRQSLKVELIRDAVLSDTKNWDVEFRSIADSLDKVNISENIIDKKDALILLSPRPSSSEVAASFLEGIDDVSRASQPLFMLFFRSFIIRLIGRDLMSGSSFNFDPTICKTPDDSARSPVLERNGAGLAATIYGIEKSSNTQWRFGRNEDFRRFRGSTKKSLGEYFQLINPAISNVSAINNPIDNKITIQVSVKGEKDNIEFPLELASDGTVKWLAFIVALLTERSGFSVEEPENFLHPDVQRQAIALVRAETSASANLFVLMTTHSETLLNAAKPDELIVVSMDNGVTLSRRLDDPDLISAEIINTGFGLGYYYISGALND